MCLSGALMLEHMGHAEAARILEAAVVEQVQQGKVTPDLASQLGRPASTTEQVGTEMVARVESLASAQGAPAGRVL